MKKLDIVRTTRAGDQFHYRWAARRCLALLNPSSRLVCITIEGVSTDETPNENDGTGEEVVDVAEYHGANTVKQATKISYHQLKHSYSHIKAVVVISPYTIASIYIGMIQG